MFCVIYRFSVKEGQHERFVSAWEDITRNIYEHCGSLGSRLHRSDDREYVAYAQWPSRKIWERAQLPFGIGVKAQEEMRACCDRIETIHELEVCSDLLKDRLKD